MPHAFGAPLIDLRPPLAGRLCFLAAVLVATAMIGPLIFSHHPRPFAADFNHLWTAGKAWATGISPYGEARATLFERYGLIHTHETPPPFFYPPHSIVLFGPLGFLSPGAACFVFTLANVGMLAVTSVLAADLLRREGAKASRLALASLHAIAVVACWNAGFVIFAHNVATLFVYAAILLVLRGVQTGDAAPIAIGVFFSLISPQISAPFAFSLLLFQRTRAPALVGGFFIGVFSILGLAPGGVSSALHDFLHNLSTYADYPENAHSNQSGIGFFVETVTGVSMSSIALLAAACLILLALRARIDGRDAQTRFEFAQFSLILSLFFLPSLNHYYVVVTATAATLIMKARPMSLAAFLALAIHMRAWDILAALDFLDWFHGRRNAATIDSIAVTMMLIAALSLTFRSAQAKRAPKALTSALAAQ